MDGTEEKPRRLRWRMTLAGALVALGLQCAAPVQARCQLKVIELPVKMVGSRAIAMVGINGTKVPLLVDSGAFFSFLTDATAAQLNLRLHALPSNLHVQGVVGKVDARMTSVARLAVGDGELPDMDFVVGGNELNAGAMGLLGRNILAVADTEYDLAHGMIRLVRPTDECADANMAYWAGDTPVSAVELLAGGWESTPAIRAELLLNGHKTTALFDTGATTTVSLDAAHAAGVKDADMTPKGRMYGAGRGATQEWTASFDTVELGGERVRNNRLLVADFDLREGEMLLGSDFFLSHRIYVSRKQSRIYFTYNGGAVFALNVDAPASAAASGADAARAPAEALAADDLARRGAASLTRGDLAAALSDLDRACAMEPGNAGFFATRASVHLARRERDLALADLDAALRMDPGLADARLRRAATRTGKTERDLALADLSTLDATLPSQSQIRSAMAHMYSGLGMPTQALAQWNLWIAAHPRDIGLEQARNGRCWARVELGVELDAALEDCDKAVDADPKNPVYASNRGWLYLRLGKLQKALADFDTALALKPGVARTLYGRGEVHLGLGQATLAQADLAEARRAQPDVDASISTAGLPRAPAAAP